MLACLTATSWSWISKELREGKKQKCSANFQLQDSIIYKREWFLIEYIWSFVMMLLLCIDIIWKPSSWILFFDLQFLGRDLVICDDAAFVHFVIHLFIGTMDFQTNYIIWKPSSSIKHEVDKASWGDLLGGLGGISSTMLMHKISIVEIFVEPFRWTSSCWMEHQIQSLLE